ncbi:MAG: hypothetical protein ACE5GJ_04980 [Gemmatimonadota bacterium]
MRRRWIRLKPGRRENAMAAMAAGVVAVGVGAVAFHVTRLLLAREPLSGGSHGDSPAGSAEGGREFPRGEAPEDPEWRALEDLGGEAREDPGWDGHE